MKKKILVVLLIGFMTFGVFADTFVKVFVIGSSIESAVDKINSYARSYNYDVQGMEALRIRDGFNGTHDTHLIVTFVSKN